MKFTITINQVRALEWGLNSQQALLFAFMYECPSWTNPVKTDDGIYFAISKAKIIEELPLLTDRPDTAYRLLRALDQAGVIELSSTSRITLFRLTNKGKTWNKKTDGSEIYPSEVGEKSDLGRKNIRGGSEKSPTNKDTNNKDTNQILKSSRNQQADRCPAQKIVELFNDTLSPALPQVVIVSEARKAKIKARWNESPVHQDLDFWVDYFGMVKESDFLMGRARGNNGGKPFRASFDWLICPSNFVKVVEGNYNA